MENECGILNYCCWWRCGEGKKERSEALAATFEGVSFKEVFCFRREKAISNFSSEEHKD